MNKVSPQHGQLIAYAESGILKPHLQLTQINFFMGIDEDLSSFMTTARSNFQKTFLSSQYFLALLERFGLSLKKSWFIAGFEKTEPDNDVFSNGALLRILVSNEYDGSVRVDVSTLSIFADLASLELLVSYWLGRTALPTLIDPNAVCEYLQINDDDDDDDAIYWNRESNCLRQLDLSALTSASVSSEIEDYRSSPIHLTDDELEQFLVWCKKNSFSLRDLMCLSWIKSVEQSLGLDSVYIGFSVQGRHEPELESLAFPLSRFICVHSNDAGTGDIINSLRRLTDVLPVKGSLSESFLISKFLPEDKHNILGFFPIAFQYHISSLENVRLAYANERIEPSLLKLNIFKQGESVQVHIDYSDRHFCSAELSYLKRVFKSIIRNIVSGDSLSDIHLSDLTAEVSRQKCLEVYGGDRVFKYKTLPELYYTHYQAEEGTVAVQSSHGSLSWAELEEKSNQFARYLLDFNYPPETIIGVCLGSSAEQLVIVLGILKASFAFLPIDPESHGGRTTQILDLTGCQLLVCSQSSMYALEELDCSMFIIDRDWYEVEYFPTDHILKRILPDQLAYVIFTSGSTGIPKAVGVPHRAIANYLQAIDEVVNPLGGGEYVGLSAISADLGYTALWGAICFGRTLRIVDKDEMLDSQRMRIALSNSALGLIKAVPSHFFALVMNNQKGGLEGENILLGGEVLSPRMLEASGVNAKKNKVFNHYGPTETAVGVLVKLVDKERKYQEVPLGRPLRNNKVYVLDQFLNPLKVGAEGDIYIGGANLARGYINNPIQTALGFIPNPFSNEGGRLYKTGDRGVFNSLGEVLFRGRVDQQVKVRGFRVELGEVESAILDSTMCRDCAATYSKELGISAAVVLKDGYELSAVTSFVRRNLPDYMCPSRWCSIEFIPRTANNKVDIRALRQIAENVNDIQYVAPVTDAERLLCDIFSELFNRNDIGTSEDFLRLGGDSIVAIQVVSRARDAGFEINLKSIFDHPVILDMAGFMVRACQARAVESAVGQFSVSPIARRFLTENTCNLNHYNQTCLLELRVILPNKFIDSMFDALVSHHDALRSRFLKCGSNWEQIIDKKINSQVHHIELDLSTDADHDRSIYNLAKEKQNTLDLEHGPLFQMFHINTRQRQYLLVIAHHLIIDGISWRILLDDISILADTYTSDRNKYFVADLPFSKSCSYRQWSISQTASIAEYERSEMQFWRSQASPLTVVPTSRQQTTTKVRDLEVARLRIAHDASVATFPMYKERFGAGADQILLSFLLMAYQKVLMVQGATVMMEGHGRDGTLDLHRTIGWFTNIYPLRFTFSEVSVNQWILLVKDICASAKNKSGYGILRHCHDRAEVRESLNCNPDFSFNYLGSFQTYQNSERKFNVCSHDIENTSDGDLIMLSPVTFNIFSSADGLNISCLFDKRLMREEKINDILNLFIKHLNEVPKQIIDREYRYYSPSDFPLLKFTQDQIDVLLDKPAVKHRRNSIVDIYPATSSQVGMLYYTTHGDVKSAYNIQSITEINHALDVEAFKYAWKKIISLHDVYRTQFIGIADDSPVQIVYKEVDFPFVYLDVSDLSTIEKDLRLSDLYEDELAVCYDENDCCLMRLKLIKVDQEKYIFVWTMHHAISDGWSKSIVMSQWREIYDNYVQGVDSNIVVPSQYKHFIEQMQQKDWGLARDYWSLYLMDISLYNGVVPKDESLVIDEIPDCSEVQIPLQVENLEKINFWCQNQGATLSSVFQVLWGILISRYSQSDKVTFGYTTSGRNKLCGHGMNIVGPLINTLPIKLDLSARQTFSELVNERMNDSISGADYGYLPLSEILQSIKVKPGELLFESIVVFDNYPTFENDALNQFVNLERYTSLNHYPLSLVVLLGAHNTLILKYDNKLVSKSLAAALIDNFCRILYQVSDGWDVSVGELCFIECIEGYIEATSDSWPAHANFKQTTLQSLFYKHIPEDLSVPAIIDGDKVVSYHELEERSNQIARLLLSIKDDKNLVVGVFFPASVDQVTSILATIKAGATFLPLDSDAPSARTRSLIANSHCQIVITNSDCLDKLGQEDLDCEILLLDRDAYEFEHLEKEVLPLVVAPQDTAYVIFTSGSTGLPKGVAVSHNAIANYLNAMELATALPNHGVWSNLSAVSTDLGYTTLFGALCFGRTFKVFSKSVLLSPYELVEQLKATPIECLKVVPSHLATLMNYDPGILPKSLLILGGELLGGELVRGIRETGWRGRIINHYGPTETTVGVLCNEVGRSEGRKVVPVGRPLTNNSVFILDVLGRQLPFGAIGEICIAGNNLAEGYLGLPLATAQGFTPLPTGSKGERLYRTGDLGYFNAKGEVVCLGRADEQIKINGVRIELGEIEAQIRVVTKSDAACTYGREEGITAYVENEVNIDELIETLSELLVATMIPNRIVIVKSIPRRSNGKLDKVSLLKDSSPISIKPFRKPQTETEIKLALMISRFLCREVAQINVKDSLYELGVHSLLLIRIIGELDKHYGVRFSIANLNKCKDVESLARLVDLNSTSQRFLDEAEIYNNAITGEFLLTGIENWFLTSYESGAINRDKWVNIYEVSLKPPVSINQASRAVELLVSYHDGLRSTFFKRETAVRMGFSYQTWGKNILPPGNDNLIQQLSLRGKNADDSEHILLDAILTAKSRIASLEGVLFQCLLIENDSGLSLGIIAHHLVHDRTSFEVIMRHLNLLLDAMVYSKDLNLEQKSDSMATVATVWNDYASGAKDLEKYSAFWKSVPWHLLQPICPDAASQPIEHNAGSYVQKECSSKLTKSLLSEVLSKSNASLSEVIIWALTRVISKKFCIPSLFTSVVSDGRDRDIWEELDLSNTVGWLAESQKFVLHFEDNGGITEELASVQKQLHQGKKASYSFNSVRSQINESFEQSILNGVEINYRGMRTGDVHTDLAVQNHDGRLSSLTRSDEQLVKRDYLITLNAIVVEGQLFIALVYNDCQFRRSTIVDIADSFVQTLEDLVLAVA